MEDFAEFAEKWRIEIRPSESQSLGQAWERFEPGSVDQELVIALPSFSTTTSVALASDMHSSTPPHPKLYISSVDVWQGASTRRCRAEALEDLSLKAGFSRSFSPNSSKPSPRAAVRMVSQSDPNSPEPGVIRRILQHFWLLPCLSEVTVRSNPPNLAQS
ncbi:hypothetical protein BKA70DRAFT_1462078 [Coprinopsis sp. MPI-PUGE-AT-0042]|nr:hypothetical protein BKA70DRAFT_1462078 [Coprinopsis sp. MPI-PUGE-AT-0042]